VTERIPRGIGFTEELVLVGCGVVVVFMWLFLWFGLVNFHPVPDRIAASAVSSERGSARTDDRHRRHGAGLENYPCENQNLFGFRGGQLRKKCPILCAHVPRCAFAVFQRATWAPYVPGFPRDVSVTIDLILRNRQNEFVKEGRNEGFGFLLRSSC